MNATISFYLFWSNEVVEFFGGGLLHPSFYFNFLYFYNRQMQGV